ncbi:Protein of unknown function [Gryllus bimaculatus]|nr:Protein of unknown function [Gryllus bimaculatus]
MYVQSQAGSPHRRTADSQGPVLWPLARLGSQNEMHLPPCALVLPPPPPPKQQPSLLTHTRSPLLTSLWPARKPSTWSDVIATRHATSA